MFRLNKHKSVRSSDRFSFNFSSFQIVKVPKGWDKLLVSIVSMQTGKTIAKLGKASVRNGNCRWTETLTESLPVSQLEGNPKELEECLLKFSVTMGTSRSGILGEANINLARYTSSKASVPLSLPLSKCDDGTILQLKIQCLTPRTSLREEQKTNPDSQGEHPEEYDEMETKSDLSGSALSRSFRSSTSNRDESMTHISREPSFSGSGSRHSFDSVEGSSGKDSFSPRNKFSRIVNSQIGRQDSTGSQNSIASLSFNSSDDGTKSNNLSFNSNPLPPPSPHKNQREQFGQNPDVASSLFRDVGSSKELMEAAEVKTGELRAESKIWERNAKKSMLDMEALRQELSVQSEKGETLAMELSASQRECDSLNLEVSHLKSLLEETKTKAKAADERNLQDKDAYRMQKELEDEIRFQKQSNGDLAEQLQKTQDSNVELLSILQELEGIIETQKAEIDSLSAEKLNLEESCVDSNSMQNNLQTQLQNLLQTQETLESKIQALESTLEHKNREIEMEQGLKDQSLIDCEVKWKALLATKEEEIVNLEAKLSQSSNIQGSKESDSDTGHNFDLAQEVELLKMKLVELESDCNELVEENLHLALKLKEARKDSVTSDDHDALPTSHQNHVPGKSGPELSQLGTRFCDYQEELQRKESFVDQETSSSQLAQTRELENKCSELEIQLEMYKDKALHLENELNEYRVQVEEQLEIQPLQQSAQKAVPEDHCSVSSDDLSSAFSVLHEQLHYYLTLAKNHWHTASLQYLESIGFSDDFDLTCTEPAPGKEQIEVILKFLHQLGELFKALGDSLEKDDTRKNEDLFLDCSGPDQESKDSELTEELAAKVSEIEVLRTERILKEEEIQKLLNKQIELESQISNLQLMQLEESKETNETERDVTFQQVNDSSNELMLLNTNMESQVAANKLLERKSSELEKGKEDLELHLSELEEENMQLSERISALEAQLRYLTDEKESCRLQLQHSDCEVVNLHDEIKRLESEMEIQRVDMKQKMQDLQKRWLDAQEECEYLQKANPKLQLTVENLIEECNSLQKLNTDLKMQTMDLHTRNVMLEAQVKYSQERFSKCSFKIESLEGEFSSMLEEIALKEKILNSEIESLIHENRAQEEKLIAEQRLLNQMYSEKALEAENLQKELVHLIDQISATDGETEELASEAIRELSSLRTEKSKLESTLEELRGKFASSQKKLNEFQIESEAKRHELIKEVNYSRQKQEVLLADHEKLSVMLESVKCSEEKCKSSVHDLEVKLKASEYEKLQLSEQISVLREQLHKTAQIQDEVVTLKNSLNEVKFDNERLNSSIDLLSGDHEQLKSEKFSLAQKICSAETAISELEECRRGKIALEEKILRLEGDLNAREALCAQDAELKIELSRVKRSNKELQRKIKHLEEDREEYQHRSSLSPSSNNDVISDSKSEAKIADLESKIQSLENELAEALEANDMYKSQLKRLLSDTENTPSATPKSPANAQNGLNANDSENAGQSLEMELKDLCERYFQMSLKYAEVEAEREELVIKLKSNSNRRSWFS